MVGFARRRRRRHRRQKMAIVLDFGRMPRTQQVSYPLLHSKISTEKKLDVVKHRVTL